jgi:hypothetical protein
VSINWDRLLQWGMVGVACIVSYTQMQGDVKSLKEQWEVMDKYGPSATRDYIISSEKRLAVIEATTTVLQRDVNRILEAIRETKYANFATDGRAKSRARGAGKVPTPNQGMGGASIFAGEGAGGQYQCSQSPGANGPLDVADAIGKWADPLNSEFGF